MSDTSKVKEEIMDIWRQNRKIEKERLEKFKTLMDEYDKTIYYPAKNALIKECEKIGHSGGKYHDNGFGWSWYYCGKCGGRYDITGPNGETN